MKYNANHTVYINSEGIEVPSVTTILKILNKPAITKWANFLGFKRKNIDAVLEESSLIGTAVHEIISAYMCNMYYIWAGGRISKTLIMAYLNSFMEWKKTHNTEVIFMEHQLISNSYGGTCDFYGIVDGKYTILDFKTSKKPYSSMFLQLAAYCTILESMDKTVEQAAIIIVNSEGYNEKFMSRKDLQPYIDTFEILQQLFHKWYDINITQWGDSIV